jgi:hypothetical protein
MKILSSALNKLRNSFREFFPYNTDAAINLVDALSCNTSAHVPIELTLNPAYERHYSTLTHAISDYYKPRDHDHDQSVQAKVDVDKKIQNTLCQCLETPNEQDYHLFAIDVTPYKRPYSDKLTDKGFVHVNETISGKKPIAIGHKYSCVAYLTKEKHWAPPLSIKRVSTADNECVFGVQQWTDIINDTENKFDDKRSVGVFDSAYSTAKSIFAFSEAMKERPDKAILIARLRADRVLMRPNEKPPTGKRGRTASFDTKNPFRLKEADSWGDPLNKGELKWVTKRGKNHIVMIQTWSNLRMRSHNDCPIPEVPLIAIKITVTDTDGKMVYKNPLWLVVVGSWPESWNVRRFWDFYTSRFDIEHLFKFGKQRLLMTSYQTPDTTHEENWVQFSMIAYHQLYHARQLAKNLPKPWEKKADKLEQVEGTKGDHILPPSRVQRDMANVLKQLPKITAEVKPRGIPSGRGVGETLTPRESSPVVRKGKVKTTPKPQIRIIWPLETINKRRKPRIKYEGVQKEDIPSDVSDIITKIEEITPVAVSPPA